MRRLVRVIEGVVTDVRHTFRFLRRRPGFALVAVVTIAVGIGSLTVGFTAINAVLYRGLLGASDVRGGGRVYVDDRGQNEGEASRLEYQAFVDDVPSLEIAASSMVMLSHRAGGSQFSGLELRSPATLALTAATLLPVMLEAAVMPGRRAARVSPLEALRSE